MNPTRVIRLVNGDGITTWAGVEVEAGTCFLATAEAGIIHSSSFADLLAVDSFAMACGLAVETNDL